MTKFKALLQKNCFRIKGGRQYWPVTLFWIIAALFVIGTFLFTRAHLTPRDSLIRFVPHYADVYFHYEPQFDKSGRGMYMFDIPAGLQPEEAASVRFKAGDGKPKWITLVSWRKRSRISNDQASVLRSAGAERIGDATYALGGSQLAAIELQSTAERGISLDDTRAGIGLDLMRTIATMQGYMRNLPVPEHAANMGFEDASAVFGSVITDSNIYIVIHPTSSLPDRKSWLGFGMPAPDRRPLPRLMTDPGADAAIGYNRESPGSLAIAFGRLLDAATLKYTPVSKKLVDSERALSDILKTPSSIMLYGRGAVPSSKRADFAVHVPQISPDELKQRILDYLGAVFPTVDKRHLPDEDTINEFIFDRETHEFVPLQTEYGPAEELSRNRAGLKLVVASDKEGGALLLSDENVLNSLIWPQARQAGRCSPINPPITLTISKPDHYEDEFSLPGNLLTKLRLNSMVFHIIGDNIAIFCGNNPQPVDK